MDTEKKITIGVVILVLIFGVLIIVFNTGCVATSDTRDTRGLSERICQQNQRNLMNQSNNW